MGSFRDRLIQSSPVWSELMQRSKALVQNALVTGATAGIVAVANIQKGDELVSVINLTDGADVTAEFKATDDGDNLITRAGFIDNTGGSTTATDDLLVSWLAWIE